MNDPDYFDIACSASAMPAPSRTCLLSHPSQRQSRLACSTVRTRYDDLTLHEIPDQSGQKPEYWCDEVGNLVRSEPRKWARTSTIAVRQWTGCTYSAERKEKAHEVLKLEFLAIGLASVAPVLMLTLHRATCRKRQTCSKLTAASCSTKRHHRQLYAHNRGAVFVGQQ